ncbi:MAG: putA, partial [Gammaproteobacteria bacterium]|nr:putA [Gammaproteobacteria bacterium]
MSYSVPLKLIDPLRIQIANAYRMDENEAVNILIGYGSLSDQTNTAIEAEAQQLISAVREQKKNAFGLDNFLKEFQLNSQEGIALMCLAEALLRVPDQNTVDNLIYDKISKISQSDNEANDPQSFFMNATTWALMLTGKVTSWRELKTNTLGNVLKRLVQRSGEPVIR